MARRLNLAKHTRRLEGYPRRRMEAEGLSSTWLNNLQLPNRCSNGGQFYDEANRNARPGARLALPDRVKYVV